MRYVDVILPLPLHATFTYAVPETMPHPLTEGCRVIVPFGSRKIYTALVLRVHDTPSEGMAVKEVYEVLDTSPVLLPGQLDFWRWIADYYLCTEGEVFKAALPSGMKLESESKVMLNPEYEGDEVLTEAEASTVALLSRKTDMTVQELQKESGRRQVLTLLKHLLDKGVVLMKEEVRRSYRPRTEVRVRLTEPFFSETALQQAFDDLRRAKKQQELLRHYVELSGAVAAIRLQHRALLKEVGRRTLAEAANVALPVCQALVEKGILETYSATVGRLDGASVMEVVGAAPLSDAQQKAYDAILQHFVVRPVCLLHGVTSSGKTEVYIHLIQQAIARGQQVLFLVPEIVLTTQLTTRLYRVFGTRMGVYHSKFSDAERVEIWQKQLSEQPYDIIVGVRSSVFLPFRRLGLVVVDEEHEGSYKQQEPAPRYHARNAAMVLARMAGAKVLLGSATPSVETYYNVKEGKYGGVSLTQRYGDVQLPEVEVVDIKELHRKRRMVGPFSPTLLSEIREALERREQVILFQNRRGYAPMMECHACGWVPRCPNCDVSLTLHKGMNRLTCHYCGYTCTVPQQCPACHETKWVQRGFGTEKIEDDVQLIFPDVKVARMDLDTTRSKSAYEGILQDFQEGRTQLLIGTQMVTKGLDFDRVSVVGILHADAMMNIPDFRSFERAYQLMSQVAGRAGRRRRQGRVILQTKSPDLPLIHQVVHHDFEGMYVHQLEERRLFMFPPFCRLVYVYMKHRDAALLDRMAADYAARLRQIFGHRVFGPDVPPVGRIQLLHIRKMMVKMEPEASMQKVRHYLRQVQQQMTNLPDYKGVQVYYDVDPV